MNRSPLSIISPQPCLRSNHWPLTSIEASATQLRCCERYQYAYLSSEQDLTSTEQATTTVQLTLLLSGSSEDGFTGKLELLHAVFRC